MFVFKTGLINFSFRTGTKSCENCCKDLLNDSLTHIQPVVQKKSCVEHCAVHVFSLLASVLIAPVKKVGQPSDHSINCNYSIWNVKWAYSKTCCTATKWIF